MSRVGKTGVGEMGIGETGVGEMGVGETGPNLYKTFFMLSSAGTKIYPAHNVKMPTVVGIFTFISRINYRLWSYKPSISIYLGYFGIYEPFKC